MPGGAWSVSNAALASLGMHNLLWGPAGMGKEKNMSLEPLLRSLPHTGGKQRFGAVSCSELTGGRLISSGRTIGTGLWQLWFLLCSRF